MTLGRRFNLIIPMYIASCMLLAVIIAWTDVKFFEGELKEHDKKVFSKVMELDGNLSDVDNYMKQVEKIINEDDLAILYDYVNSRVVDSINVVVGEQYEEQVHKAIELNDEKIRLDSSKLEFNKNTYIHDINLKIDDLNFCSLNAGYVLYYIPRRIVMEKYLVRRLLQALSLSCFFSAATIMLFDQQVKKLINKS